MRILLIILFFILPIFSFASINTLADTTLREESYLKYDTSLSSEENKEQSINLTFLNSLENAFGKIIASSKVLEKKALAAWLVWWGTNITFLPLAAAKLSTLSIQDLNDDFIASLTLSYYKKEHILSLDEWILLRQKTGAIGTILTDYLHDRK